MSQNYQQMLSYIITTPFHFILDQIRIYVTELPTNELILLQPRFILYKTKFEFMSQNYQQMHSYIITTPLHFMLDQIQFMSQNYQQMFSYIITTPFHFI